MPSIWRTCLLSTVQYQHLGRVSPRNESSEPPCREELLEIQGSDSSRISRVYKDKGCCDRLKGQTIYVIRQYSRSISKFIFQFLLLASYQVVVQQCVVSCSLNDVRYISAIHYYQPSHCSSTRTLSTLLNFHLCMAGHPRQELQTYDQRFTRSRHNVATRALFSSISASTADDEAVAPQGRSRVDGDILRVLVQVSHASSVRLEGECRNRSQIYQRWLMILICRMG